MRKLFVILLFSFSLAASGQSDTVKAVKKLNGTGKCYTDKYGVKYPVYITPNDKLFIVVRTPEGDRKKYLIK